MVPQLVHSNVSQYTHYCVNGPHILYTQMYHRTLTYSVNGPHILNTQMYHSTLTYSVIGPHSLNTQMYHSTLTTLLMVHTVCTLNCITVHSLQC
jgi:hypothetical protein